MALLISVLAAFHGKDFYKFVSHFADETRKKLVEAGTLGPLVDLLSSPSTKVQVTLV